MAHIHSPAVTKDPVQLRYNVYNLRGQRVNTRVSGRLRQPRLTNGDIGETIYDWNAFNIDQVLENVDKSCETHGLSRCDGVSRETAERERQNGEHFGAILCEFGGTTDRRITFEDLANCNEKYYYEYSQLFPTAQILLKIGDTAVRASAIIDASDKINLISRDLIGRTRMMKSCLKRDGALVKVEAALAIPNETGTINKTLVGDFIVIRKLSLEMPRLKPENFEVLRRLPLADPKTIDVVIGSTAADFLFAGECGVDDRGYYYTKTKLGYVVSSTEVRDADLQPFNYQSI